MTGPYRRLRSHGAIPTSTKTISFTGCRFDLAQLADAEAAGAFAGRPLSHHTTQVQIDTRCSGWRCRPSSNAGKSDTVSYLNLEALPAVVVMLSLLSSSVVVDVEVMRWRGPSKDGGPSATAAMVATYCGERPNVRGPRDRDL